MLPVTYSYHIEITIFRYLIEVKMIKSIQTITQRIIDRSRVTRKQYLMKIEQAKTHQVARAGLACSNFAHGFAGCCQEDKTALKNLLKSNIGIITSYNDMLSAHKPYETYPPQIRQALSEVGSVGQVAVSLSHNMYDGALYLGVCDKIVPGLMVGALTFGHLPAVFIPSGPMPSRLPNSQLRHELTSAAARHSIN